MTDCWGFNSKFYRFVLRLHNSWIAVLAAPNNRLIRRTSERGDTQSNSWIIRMTTFNEEITAMDSGRFVHMPCRAPRATSERANDRQTIWSRHIRDGNNFRQEINLMTAIKRNGYLK